MTFYLFFIQFFIFSVGLKPIVIIAIQDQFDKISLLGKGGWGRVHLVRKNIGADTGTYYALKQCNLAKLGPGCYSSLKFEQSVLMLGRLSKFLVGLEYCKFYRFLKLILLLFSIQRWACNKYGRAIC